MLSWLVTTSLHLRVVLLAGCGTPEDPGTDPGTNPPTGGGDALRAVASKLAHDLDEQPRSAIRPIAQRQAAS